MQSGITMLGGLVGNIDIPRKTATSQHYWVGEDEGITASDVTFGLISGTPKTIGARVPVSRRMLIQSTPDIDTIVRGDMAEKVALGIDASGLYGTGTSAQPLGLFNVTGIGSVTMAGGASMVYPAGLGSGTHDTGDWADYVNLRAGAYAGNVDVTNGRYIMNGVTMAGCEQTLRASAAGSDYIVNDQGNIGRYPVLMSNQLQTNDVAFGDFSDMILAMWGGLDIVVDNVTQAPKGQVVFTAMQDIDWICRRPASFSRGT
jgi:HK97 family phage major capsid protein